MSIQGAGATARLNICVILDESGSMAAVQAATISGFNEFLNDQKKDSAGGGDGVMTLTKFNTEFNRIFTATPIRDVAPLAESSYTPGGMTALHDAIAHTIKTVEKEVPAGERVLCCIITDGEENSSREHSLTEVKALIEAKEKSGLWTFAYLGANQDAWVIGQKLGLQSGNVANYMATPTGTHAAFRAMSSGANALRASSSGRTSAYYGGKDVVDPGDAGIPAQPLPVVPTPIPAATSSDKPTWRKGR